MGYQPSLDGVRAVSVIAVLLYHGGFSWMHGGFFGVEVFFVVSGFLITSLLLDEREKTGGVSLGQFWLRRARRLLPALVLVLVATGVYATLWGDAQMQSDLRRDFPWAIFYAANWGQIVGGAQYFGNLSPLRHLWSLAVEEQWYLVWPLLFLGLTTVFTRARVRAGLLLTLAVGVMVLTWWMARDPQLTDDRVNFLYLSTLTRSSGLLLGAGAAFVWRPWRNRRARDTRAWWLLDVIAVAAVGVLGWQFVDSLLTDRSIYRWQLATVTLASLALVLVVVHPASRLARPVFAFRPVAEVGKRSYGLYLWSWPVSVACEAYTGSWSRFGVAMGTTVVLSELSYRFVETPIRRGALGRWFAVRSIGPSGHWHVITTSGAITVIALLAPLTVFFSRVEHVDPAAGGAEAVFVLPAAGDVAVADAALAETVASAPTAVTAVTGVAGATESSAAASESTLATTAGALATEIVTTTVPAPPVTAPVLPRRIVVVGDSMAHSLAINLPDGIGSTFTIEDGSVDGCSVYDTGDVRSQRSSFSRSFLNCEGWSDRWVEAAVDSQSNLALVVIGAWDVFDVDVDGRRIPFASAEGDARFLAGLQQGIDALVANGVHVALLEVACMRPADAKGAGVPALPERGDDGRVAHLNELLRQVAAEQSETVSFVPGPVQWCTDEAIATDLGYRWDGVHVYKPGANLVYMTIAQSLLDIPL
jgi:peptidoglycan/LPS O-acetylase OafA/YrhL